MPWMRTPTIWNTGHASCHFSTLSARRGARRPGTGHAGSRNGALSGGQAGSSPGTHSLGQRVVKLGHKFLAESILSMQTVVTKPVLRLWRAACGCEREEGTPKGRKGGSRRRWPSGVRTRGRACASTPDGPRARARCAAAAFASPRVGLPGRAPSERQAVPPPALRRCRNGRSSSCHSRSRWTPAPARCGRSRRRC